MSDGTSAQGRKNTPKHKKCRRCGNASFHVSKKVCASCGFGRSAKRRDYAWTSKAGDH